MECRVLVSCVCDGRVEAGEWLRDPRDVDEAEQYVNKVAAHAFARGLFVTLERRSKSGEKGRANQGKIHNGETL